MDIIEAIKTRASTRAFLDRPVKKVTIEKILDAARWAPSGTNAQPWDVAIVTGKSRKDISKALLEQFRSGQKANPDYFYYPTKWFEPYKSRRFNCGMALYEALDIKREDTERRKQVWEWNYMAFGAPVMLFFFIDKKLEKGSWLDYGMFLQNIMLAAREFDLASCPQAALAEYPDTIRKYLGLHYADKQLICGLSLGYPDVDADVNCYRTERVSIDEFTHWFV